MLQLFNTEDNRSSFGQPISGWPSGGGPSYGVSAGGFQHKTSSSKNKGTRKSFKSQKSFDQAISKKNNFMDEFGKFEEQFENHMSKSKSKESSNPNLKRHSVSPDSKRNQATINAQYNSLMKDLQAVTAKLL